MSAASLIDALSAIHPKGFDLSLERILRLLEALGNPQLRIPAGDPRGRHQRQGLDLGLLSRDPGSRRQDACMSTPRRIW